MSIATTSMPIYLPICSRWEICNLGFWNVWRYKGRDRMANEHIGMLDIAPEKLPYVCLRCAILHSQVTPDLNMAPVQDWSVWCQFLDKRYQARHLGIINLFSVRTLLSESCTI